MILRELNLLNFKNIEQASLHFADRLNCLIGLNGQGKTNVLDAIYMLSFTKSAFAQQDNLSIRHGETTAMVQGLYEKDDEVLRISCGLKQGGKKVFRRGDKAYSRLSDHIGLLPLVLISPQDLDLVLGGSEVRRRFLDGTLSQYDPAYLPTLNAYSQLLMQRNALLKQLADNDHADLSVLSVYDEQMAPLAEQIYAVRRQCVELFVPYFTDTYAILSDEQEQVSLTYNSQLAQRQVPDVWSMTRERDRILGWTSVGVHKDDLQLTMNGYPLRQVASQGQMKTCLLALRLAQALFLTGQTRHAPLLLLDDLFDRLDSQRVTRFLQFVVRDTLFLPSLQTTIEQPFAQIFLTDTDLNHLARLLDTAPDPSLHEQVRFFEVSEGRITQRQS